MGRYYSGDIEGKFWFAVQSSGDANFFGGCASEPQEINYLFTEDDLPTIEEGIEECKAKLGDNKAKLGAFFAEDGPASRGYTNKTVAEYLGLKHDAENEWAGGPAAELLAWYARLELGEKILACVKEKGECNFTAEC